MLRGGSVQKSNLLWKRWLRPAIVIPVCASVVVHAALLASIEYIKLTPRAPLTDAVEMGTETSLALTPVSPPPRVVTRSPPPPIAPAPPVAPKRVPEPEVVPAPANPEALGLWSPAKPIEAKTPTPLTTPVEVAKPNTPVAEAEPESVPTPAPIAAPVSFAGVEAVAAERIVYALDASGAMTTSLPYVKVELARSISRLAPVQRFQIVVFRQPPGAAAARIDLFETSESFVAATDEAKTRAGAWIADVQPAGSSQPLAGLRSALGYKPNLVFLLTRSIRRSGPSSAWGEGTEATLAELDRLNPKGVSGTRETVIKAIQFLDGDPTGMLQRIANTHGDGPGSYRVIVP